MTVDQGKVYGPGPGYTLDTGSVKRAFAEWRNLCINNRMQWGLLMDRLHGANRSLRNVLDGKSWSIPETPDGQALGPLSQAASKQLEGLSMYEAYLRKSICVNHLRNQPEEPEKNNQSHGSDLKP